MRHVHKCKHGEFVYQGDCSNCTKCYQQHVKVEEQAVNEMIAERKNQEDEIKRKNKIRGLRL